MQPYIPNPRPASSRVLMLMAGAVIVGCGLGILAHFISNFFYLILVFPILVGFATIIAFGKLVTLARVSHSKLVLAALILTSLFVAFSYYETPFLLWRGKQISELQKTYNVDASRAAYAVDRYIKEESGLPGLLGFMGLRAQAGEGFSNYLMVNSVTVPLFNFTFKGIWAWMHWWLEILLILIPMGYVGRGVDGGRFNRSSDNWYNSPRKQVGSFPIDCQPQLIDALNHGDTAAIAALLQPEDAVQHPMLEIYEQHTRGAEGSNVLLGIRSTRRVDARTVKRQRVGEWEISPEEYAAIFSEQAVSIGAFPSLADR